MKLLLAYNDEISNSEQHLGVCVGIKKLADAVLDATKFEIWGDRKGLWLADKTTDLNSDGVPQQEYTNMDLYGHEPLDGGAWIKYWPR